MEGDAPLVSPLHPKRERSLNRLAIELKVDLPAKLPRVGAGFGGKLTWLVDRGARLTTVPPRVTFTSAGAGFIVVVASG